LCNILEDVQKDVEDLQEFYETFMKDLQHFNETISKILLRLGAPSVPIEQDDQEDQSNDLANN